MTRGIQLKTLTNDDLHHLGLPAALLAQQTPAPRCEAGFDCEDGACQVAALTEEPEPIDLVRAVRQDLEQTLAMLEGALAAIARRGHA
jgi:hypothetical protein